MGKTKMKRTEAGSGNLKEHFKKQHMLQRDIFGETCHQPYWPILYLTSIFKDGSPPQNFEIVHGMIDFI